MAYARWMTKEELQNSLTKINKDSVITKSGIPYTYDDENLYISNDDYHTLVIGTTGSGKTQSTILPSMKLAMLANENVLVNDPNGELYDITSKMFEEKGYEIVRLNYNDLTKSCSYNPLSLPYQIYKEGDKDTACDLVSELSTYFFHSEETSQDPFWINSARDYFVGLTLYLFDKSQKEEVTLQDVFELSVEFEEKEENETKGKKALNTIDKLNSIYVHLSGTVNAPTETRGGIISVFTQKIRLFISRENLNNSMSKSDYNLKELVNKKHIVYVTGNLSGSSKYLMTPFISQYIYCNKVYGNKEVLKNIILDEFESLLPLEKMVIELCNARTYGIRFTIVIKGFEELKIKFGKSALELGLFNCGSIIYLLSNEEETLEEISKLCGRQSENSRLIENEELKLLKMFEAVILKNRCHPIKTKLIPDYEIEWPSK